MTDTARPGATGERGADVLRVPAVDAARAMVTAAAPTQLPHFDQVTEAWDEGVLPGRGPAGWTGGSVGSNIDPQVLSDVVYPLLTSTVAQVVGAAGFLGLQRRKWWRRKPKGQLKSAVLEVPAAKLDEFHRKCVAHGTTLGLSVEEATLMADALIGFLRNNG